MFELGTREYFGAGDVRCELHRAGCRDIARAGFAYIDAVGSLEDAVAQGLADADDIRVMPCARQPQGGDTRVIEGFLGSCECGFETDDLPTKGLVRAAMVQHFEQVGAVHEWERVG